MALLSALALMMSARGLGAQVAVGRVGTPDSAQMMAVMAAGMRMLRPAEFVLAHQAELTLTPEQVTRLTTLSAAQIESVTVRQKRASEQMLARMRSAGAKGSYANAMLWTGEVDEQAIRDAAREQSAMQAETMINMARDRHAVAALLTPGQVALLPRIEAGEMMRRMAPMMPAPTGDKPYFEFQVERHVVQVPGSPSPKYPDALRANHVEGSVLAQFIVDTTGRAEIASFKVLKSDHGLFTDAVKAALPEMHFVPAEVGGHKVRQLVQQPFMFAAPKEP